MCTLSIIATAPGEFVLGFNRDEQRRRAAEDGPTEFQRGERRSIEPRDPEGGGTWIAANDAGLAFALLNRNEPGLPDATAAGASRGTIVPEACAGSTLHEAIERVVRLAPSIARGYRLVATDGGSIVEAIGGLGRIEIALHPIDVPFTLASSGLGDRLVVEPRRALFESMVASRDAIAWPRGQREFHDHRWEDRTPISVRMDRTHACTTSRTFIERRGETIVLEHAMRDGDGFAAPRWWTLPCGSPR